MSAIKEEVRRIADSLPDDATWEDVMEEVYVQKVIADGLEDVKAGRVLSAEQVRKNLRLRP